MVRCLLENLSNMEPQYEIGKNLKLALKAETDKRFGNIESAHLLSLATILDPRFKTIHHSDPVPLGKFTMYLNHLIEEQVKQKDKEVMELEVIDKSQEKNSELDIWDIHRKLAQEKNKIKVTNKCSELSLYLSNPVSTLKDDPLNVWESTKHVYPNLYPIARKYLSPVATSVPSERLFSKAGLTVSQRRNRLSSGALTRLLFLGSLPESYWSDFLK